MVKKSKKVMTASNAMKSRGAIFLLCLFFSCTLHAQELSCINTISTDLGISSLDEDIIWCSHGNSIYYISQRNIDKKARTLKVFSIDLENNRKDSLLLDIPVAVTIVTLPFSFAVGDDYLVFNDDYDGKIVLYERIKKEFRFKKFVEIENGLRFRSVTCMNKNIFLFYEIYASASSAPPVTIATYDAGTASVINVIHPALNCMSYSYFPVTVVANTSKLIAVADLCEYKISIYDQQLNQLTALTYGAKGRKYLRDAKLPFETDPMKVHPKTTISQLLEFESSVERIDQLFFLNDSVLLVLSNHLNRKKSICRADLWNINNVSEPILSFNRQPVAFDSAFMVESSHLPLLIDPLIQPVIRSGQLSGISRDPFLPSDHSDFKLFQNKKDSYYESNDPRYHYQRFTIELPDSE
jgi:hypothetical protein